MRLASSSDFLVVGKNNQNNCREVNVISTPHHSPAASTRSYSKILQSTDCPSIHKCHHLSTHFQATHSALLPTRKLLVSITLFSATWCATAAFVSEEGKDIQSSREGIWEPQSPKSWGTLVLQALVRDPKHSPVGKHDWGFGTLCCIGGSIQRSRGESSPAKQPSLS